MSFWADKNELVTGGKGFLGSCIVKDLEKRGCKNIFVFRGKDYDLVDNNACIKVYMDVVGPFPDGQSALMLVAAGIRHIAGTKWGTKRYLSMDGLRENGKDCKSSFMKTSERWLLKQKCERYLKLLSFSELHHLNFIYKPVSSCMNAHIAICHNPPEASRIGRWKVVRILIR